MVRRVPSTMPTLPHSVATLPGRRVGVHRVSRSCGPPTCLDSIQKLMPGGQRMRDQSLLLEQQASERMHGHRGQLRMALTSDLPITGLRENTNLTWTVEVTVGCRKAMSHDRWCRLQCDGLRLWSQTSCSAAQVRRPLVP